MGDTKQAIRDVAKGASVVYAGLFLELLIAFLAQVLAARYLSVSEFGGITTGTALLNIGSIVAGLGLASGLTRYLPRIGEEKKRPLTTFVVAIAVVSSSLVGVTTILGAEFLATDVFGNPEVAVSIRIFGAAIPFAALLNVGIGGIRGQKHSLYQVVVKNIAHPLVRFALVIGAVVYGFGEAGLASAYAIPYILSALIALFFLYRTLPSSGRSFDVGLTAEVARFSLPFTLSGVAGFVYRSIDIFLILRFLGSFAVGLYGVAYAAVSFMGMFSTAFNYMGAPVASELESDGNVEEVMRVFRSVARWLVIGSVCALVPLFVFSTEFISIIYRSKYTGGGPALSILAVGFAVKNVLSIHGPILTALGRSKTLSFNSVVAGIANVVLNLVLIPAFGIEGAAVATVLSFLLRDTLATAQVWYLLETTPITWTALRPVVVAAPLLAAFAGYVAPAIPTTLLWLLAATGAFGVVYLGGVLLAFGLSDTEVMLIRSAEEQYGIDLTPIDPIIHRLSNK